MSEPRRRPETYSRALAAQQKKVQGRFIAAFIRHATVYHAAKAARIGRRTHYDWLARDPDYAEAFKAAQEAALDILEREARRRAVEGTLKPVYQGGELVGKVREYSDTLLIFLLKGAAPQKYRERFEHSGPGGGPIRHEYDWSRLTDEEVETIVALQRKAAVGQVAEPFVGAN